jgi:hypothetical protein
MLFRDPLLMSACQRRSVSESIDRHDMIENSNHHKLRGNDFARLVAHQLLVAGAVAIL